MIKKFIDEEYRSSLVIIHNESEFIRCQKFYFGKGYNWYFPSKKPYTFSDIENDIPTDAKEVYDVMGAGDTVIAALSLSLTSGASIKESMIIANQAAGISVSKVGTYPVKLEELREKILGGEGKLKSFDELFEIINDLKKKGKKIVWTNGKFDILHEGHVKYLKKANLKK